MAATNSFFTHATSHPVHSLIARAHRRSKPGHQIAAGGFTAVFRAWPNFFIYDDNGYTATTVDCRVRYGTSTIAQAGNSTPYIQHDSFTVSTTSLAAEDEATKVLGWQSRYNAPSSPFIFASA